jgi:hypothetical protein
MMKRIQRNASQWEKLIEAQKQSGLNIKEYCQQNTLTTSNFYGWRKRLKTVKVTPTSPLNNEHKIQADWLKLDLEPKSPTIKTWDIELHLPNGIVLKMNQASC